MCLSRPVTSTELCGMHWGVSWLRWRLGDIGHIGCHRTCLPGLSILVASVAWELCLPSPSTLALPGGDIVSGCQEAIHLFHSHQKK